MNTRRHVPEVPEEADHVPFGLTDEQRDLQREVRNLLDRRGSRELLRSYVDRQPVYDAEIWHLMATQLGLQGLLVPTGYGGAGASIVDIVVVQEELGRALLPSPYLVSAVLSTTAVLACGDAAAHEEILPALAAGTTTATLAWDQRTGTELGLLDLTASKTGSSWAVSGTVSPVLDGDVADLVLLPVRTPAGPSLFAIATSSLGVGRERVPGLDVTRGLATLRLENAPAELVGTEGGAASGLRSAFGYTCVALAAEQVGGARHCLDATTGYAGTRSQFGGPIGAFQSVKHKCADMFVGIETARALTRHAAWALELGADGESAMPSLTRAYASDMFVRVAGESIQLHGGVGFTWEHDCHLYFKRAVTSAQLLGSAQSHREAVATGIGL